MYSPFIKIVARRVYASAKVSRRRFACRQDPDEERYESYAKIKEYERMTCKMGRLLYKTANGIAYNKIDEAELKKYADAYILHRKDDYKYIYEESIRICFDLRTNLIFNICKNISGENNGLNEVQQINLIEIRDLLNKVILKFPPEESLFADSTFDDKIEGIEKIYNLLKQGSSDKIYNDLKRLIYYP